MTADYNNLYIHFVFTTSNRLPIIKEQYRNRIEKYITGVVKNHKCRLYAIYANPEHMHFLLSKNSSISEDQIATTIADASSAFINEHRLCQGVFAWQQTCSAFSVSKTDIKKICKYILNQPVHHKIHTFDEEYLEFIRLYQQTINPKASA